MSTFNKPAPTARPIVRCAVYTRKSTEEGLEQEFNSLDAQRECGEAYIKSQTHEGWQCVPDAYDDGGFSGGNTDRPALKRLLADIAAGKIDCVIVYKVDRLSRSLLDFAKMMDVFDKHHVSFVSVTQQINSATSMGRLMLNVLLSFAQFEREIIGERTRDKIAAARRKGKWAGGHPLLGYDIDPERFKLIVNEEEAVRLRAMFALVLEYDGLIAVVEELDRRGWVNKRWTTRKGRERGGRPFTATSLRKLLTNVAYLGKVRYKTEIHKGEQAALVDAAIWQQVQAKLQQNGRHGGASAEPKPFGALLKGVVHCVPCGCAMTPAHSAKNRTRRYRYYTCTSAQKRGWHTCPSKSIPAGEIERFVIEQIRRIGKEPALWQATFAEASSQIQARQAELETERSVIERDVRLWMTEMRALALEVGQSQSGAVVARLSDIQERIRVAEERTRAIDDEKLAFERGQVNENEVGQALAGLDAEWETLSPREQARIVQLLVERVDYDGAAKTVSITFHPGGIRTLADDVAERQKGKSA